ncbi:MAG: DUF2125 domain-containing protein [Pseudomonadota bacterium]
MNRFRLSGISLALPAALMASTAMADVTPAEVWADWQQYMQTMGYQIDATETTSGDTLTVSDITMSMQIPDQPGNFSISMGSMTFTQNGASVDVGMPETMPMTMTMMIEPGAPEATIDLTLTQIGHSMNVSGSPEEMVSSYNAANLSLALDKIEMEGETMGPDMIKAVVSIANLTNTTRMTNGDMRDYQQSGTTGAMAYDVDVNNPEEQVKFKMIGGVESITYEGSGLIPVAGVDMSDMNAMLKSGFAVAGTFIYTGGRTELEGSDPVDGAFAAKTSTSGGNFGVEMNAETLAYTGAQNDLQMNVSVPDLPFPIDLGMATSGFNIAIPVAKSDTPEDFAFAITLGDFVMSDMIWSLFDAGGQLPRDPATIELDMTGEAKMLVDIMDPAQTATAPVPAELHGLNLSKLLVSAAGAKLEGSGDFTFDNTDMSTFPGLPKPVGAIDVSLSGANGLMDKLVAMGLLPEEQAMGARMMMGMFGVPGSEPDTLNSKVEFTGDGQVLANGQRIR